MKRSFLVGAMLLTFTGLSVQGTPPDASQESRPPQTIRHLYTCSFDNSSSNYYWSDAFSTTETDNSKIFEAWDQFIAEKYGYKDDRALHCHGEGQPTLESVQRFERSQIQRIHGINPSWKMIETGWHFPGASAYGPPMP